MFHRRISPLNIPNPWNLSNRYVSLQQPMVDSDRRVVVTLTQRLTARWPFGGILYSHVVSDSSITPICKTHGGNMHHWSMLFNLYHAAQWMHCTLCLFELNLSVTILMCYIPDVQSQIYVGSLEENGDGDESVPIQLKELHICSAPEDDVRKYAQWILSVVLEVLKFVQWSLLNCMKQVSRNEAFLVPSSRTARNRTNLLFANSWWYRQPWMSEESTQSVLIRSRFQSTPKSCTRHFWTSEPSTVHLISE